MIMMLFGIAGTESRSDEHRRSTWSGEKRTINQLNVYLSASGQQVTHTQRPQGDKGAVRAEPTPSAEVRVQILYCRSALAIWSAMFLFVWFVIRPLCAVVTAIEGVVQWTVVGFRVCVEVDFWAAYLIQTYKKTFWPDILAVRYLRLTNMLHIKKMRTKNGNANKHFKWWIFVYETNYDYEKMCEMFCEILYIRKLIWASEKYVVLFVI